ncbi:MAG: hypothetical protein DRQ55_18705 [Planctomycetota bacterium]|nr:MAG: hypothetical protein DRQ55_18705 [Planctomycetota bacterium]
MPTFRPIPIRRAAAAALAGVMLLTLLPAATAMASTPPDVRAAEWKVLAQMNQFRANNGLKPLRMATRVRLVARDRSRSMKSLNYFDHVSPGGATAATLMNRRGVKYAFWGENIGWTKYMGEMEGAKWMVNWWKNSPGHRRNMLNKGFNYVGIGIAKDGPKLLYTMVLVNQRDHTPPKAGLVSSHSGISLSTAGSARNVTVRWRGKDRPLATRTAGLRGFTVTYKRGAGNWHVLRKGTKARQLTKALAKGTHSFRVRAVDNKGNKGSWMRPLVVTVH